MAGSKRRGGGSRRAKQRRGNKPGTAQQGGRTRGDGRRSEGRRGDGARRDDRRGGGQGSGAGASPRKRPDGLDGTQVEGRQAVRELLLAGRRQVREIFIGNEAERVDIVADIIALANELHVPVREVSRSKLDHMARTEAPQGIVAVARQIPGTDLAQLCAGTGGRPPFLLALDGVTDPQNLGSLLRIAECAGVNGVVLPRHRAVHVTPAVTKAAAGAVEYLPMTLVGGLPAAIDQMRSEGVWVVGLDAGGGTSVHDLTLADEPVCLVLGAEGSGLSRLVARRCDLLASVPLHGTLASLNVAAAGAVACYEVARRRA